jgi:hypothetical protein
MVLIDIYNSIITVYGTVDTALAAFVVELQTEYTDYTVQYMPDVYDTIQY